MAGGNGNGDKTLAEKISNNVYSVLIARFILPGLIALVGYFAASAFGDLKDNVKDAKTAIEAVDRRVTTTFGEFDKRIFILEQDRNNLLQRHQ